MHKSYICFTNKISLDEIQAMNTDIEDLLYLIEHFNEVLAFKMKTRHPSFAMFLRALQQNNCLAIKSTLQIKSALDKALSDYLKDSEGNEVAHS